jgi:hypothetical protein
MVNANGSLDENRYNIFRIAALTHLCNEVFNHEVVI